MKVFSAFFHLRDNYTMNFMMDSSSSKSNSLGGEEWLDLSKSDYAKVIFSNLDWNSDSGTIGCHFKLTETVNKTPSDYIGLYKVGYENLSQCLASKKISQIEGEIGVQLIHCNFKSEELPELNGFYQFLYVTQDKEVHGASMPIAVNNYKSRNDCSEDEMVTEKVEDDFLMVRYGMEQKNDLLEVMVQRLQNEKLELSNELHLLAKDKNEIHSEYDATKLQLETLLSEFSELKKEKEVLLCDLETIKKEKTAVSCEFEVVKEKIISELAIITKSADDLSNELSTVKLERDNLYSELEDCKNDKLAMISKLEELVSQLKATEGEKNNLVAEVSRLKTIKEINNHLAFELETCESNNSKLASRLADSHSALTALKIEKKRNESQLQDQILKKQLSTLEYNTQFMKTQLEGVEFERVNAVRLRAEAEKEIRQLKNDLAFLRRFLTDRTGCNNYSLWLSKEAVVKQLEESEVMLKAMEDSKQLVVKEMGELSEKLNQVKDELSKIKCENILLKMNQEDPKEKAKEELNRIKCENILLKANLEDLNEKEPKHSTENNEALKKEIIQVKEELSNSQQKVIETEKKIEEATKEREQAIFENEDLRFEVKCAHVDKKSMQLQINNFIQKLNELKERIKLVSQEKSKLKEELLIWQKTCENKLPICKDLFSKLKERNPELEECNFEKELHNLIDQFETNCTKLDHLQIESLEKDLKLEQLNEEIKRLKENEAAALDDVAEKTARLMEAAELYKKLYIGKQKLLKKMNKIVHNTSKSSLIKVLEDESAESSTESEFLPLNIKDIKQSSSSNSDSDTGEHFCPQMTPLQVKELNFQTFDPVKDTLACFQQGSLVQCSEDKTAIMNEKMLDKTEWNNKTQFSVAILPECSNLDETMYDIPCSICEKSFSVSSSSSIHLLEHYEIEHNLDMCPVCGQLFEKCVPSKYLNYHINKHFESK